MTGFFFMNGMGLNLCTGSLGSQSFDLFASSVFIQNGMHDGISIGISIISIGLIFSIYSNEFILSRLTLSTRNRKLFDEKRKEKKEGVSFNQYMNKLEKTSRPSIMRTSRTNATDPVQIRETKYER